MDSGADNNILIGYGVGANSLTTGSGNILIGYYLETPSSSTSNALNIGNLLFGTNIDGLGTTLSSGNIGIGTMNPTEKLTVAGTGSFYGIRVSSGASDGYVLTSDASGNARWAVAAGGGNNWSLSGNAIGANDFIGTINDQDLVLKRNNIEVARFMDNNVSIGSGALGSITTGINNTAV